MSATAILAAIGAVLAAVFAVFAKGRKSAKVEAELDTAKQEVKAHETRDKIERAIDPSNAAGELRKRWQR